MDNRNRNRPPVRITPEAFRRLKELIHALESKGQSVSGTSIVSDAILSIPVPLGDSVQVKEG